MTTRKSATDNGFIIFKDQLSLLKLIPNEQLGEAIKLLLENLDDLPSKENIAYELFASNIRRYRKQAEKSSTYGKLGGNPNLKPTHKGQDKDGDKGTHKQIEYNIKENNFTLFWDKYPKQRAGSKEKAYKAYCRAIKEKRVTEEQLLLACEEYAKSDEVKRGFAKGCAAWLNDDRFNVKYVAKEQGIKSFW